MSCFRLFFFFKQKTAYEMRISDWSSDVCSSDLTARRSDARISRLRRRRSGPAGVHRRNAGARKSDDPRDCGDPARQLLRPCRPRIYAHFRRRSEEHTSELQSLMRISYAVFCLKKKNTPPPNLYTIHNHQSTAKN